MKLQILNSFSGDDIREVETITEEGKGSAAKLISDLMRGGSALFLEREINGVAYTYRVAGYDAARDRIKLVLAPDEKEPDDFIHSPPRRRGRRGDTERDAQIVEDRKTMSQEEVAAKYGLSKQRVYQICQRLAGDPKGLTEVGSGLTSKRTKFNINRMGDVASDGGQIVAIAPVSGGIDGEDENMPYTAKLNAWRAGPRRGLEPPDWLEERSLIEKACRENVWRLEWRNPGPPTYQLAFIEGMNFRIIAYPHKTSAHNYHIRLRFNGGDRTAAERAIVLLNKSSGPNCTFQSKHMSSVEARVRAAEPKPPSPKLTQAQRRAKKAKRRQMEEKYAGNQRKG